MKVTVAVCFQDKFTGENYSVGDVINIDDQSRMVDLVEKGLVKVAEETVTDKAPARKTRRK